MTLTGLDDNNKPVEVRVTADGELRVTGNIAVDVPPGGATEAKQDTGNASLASIDGKLPSLSGGRVPVDGSAVTQPVSAVSLPLPGGAATAALQGGGMPAALHGGGGLKVGVLDAAGAEVFPAPTVPAGTNVAVATTKISARLEGYDSNNSTNRRLECDSSGRQIVSSVPKSSPSGFDSSGTAFVGQEASSAAFALHYAIVTADAAGWILLLDKSAAAIDTDAPIGGLSFPIAEGQTIQIGAQGAGVLYNFSTKCRLVFSSTQNVVTLGGAHMRVTVKGE